MLDAIYFPQPEAVPEFAMAFMNMMFAHAEFEEQVSRMQATIAINPDFAERRWDARKRPKRMAKLIKAHPATVQDREAIEIERILTDAIELCDQRNLFAHGRWWRFDTKTETVRIRGERKGEPKFAGYAAHEISGIAMQFKMLASDLYKLRRDIEQRRGDHDVRENDLPPV
jgi:hypothetical protein